MLQCGGFVRIRPSLNDTPPQFSPRARAMKRAASRPPRWPEHRLVLLVDRHAVAVRVSDRKRPAEWPVERLLQDLDAIGDDPFIERLRVACPPPQLDRAGCCLRCVLPARGAQRE